MFWVYNSEACQLTAVTLFTSLVQECFAISGLGRTFLHNLRATLHLLGSGQSSFVDKGRDPSPLNNFLLSWNKTTPIPCHLTAPKDCSLLPDQLSDSWWWCGHLSLSAPGNQSGAWGVSTCHFCHATRVGQGGTLTRPLRGELSPTPETGVQPAPVCGHS